MSRSHQVLVVVLFGLYFCMDQTFAQEQGTPEKTRVIVTSDGEIDDECSLVRFLLYANEWDIEGIITSSSQYHWHGHKWAGDDWIDPSLDAYAKVYPNLIKHDKGYPTPEYLRAHTFLGNVETEGEMDSITAGSQHIVKVLLDESDNRPIWIQAWGGTNTIARALKTIEEQHPDKMAYVASKIRLYLIWEQDATYQTYIRPHWGKYNIPTIISDQFIALFYHWKKYLPQEQQKFLAAPWMKENILENHGPLCASYKAHQQGDKGFEDGDFRSEGDSPAFLHTIPTGLRSMESPDWGGWGGRFVKVRDNTWLDPGVGTGLPVSRRPVVGQFRLGTGTPEKRNSKRPGADRLSETAMAMDGSVAKRFCITSGLVREALCRSQPSTRSSSGPRPGPESPTRSQNKPKRQRHHRPGRGSVELPLVAVSGSRYVRRSG